MADARSVRRRVPVAAPARRGVKLRQLEPSVAIRRLQHRDLRADALETHHAVHPTALDRSLALQLESELDEERRRGGEVVDHDAHVVHALDRHALDGSGTAAPRYSVSRCRSAGGNAPKPTPGERALPPPIRRAPATLPAPPIHTIRRRDLLGGLIHEYTAAA